jgi:hypothetical protein
LIHQVRQLRGVLLDRLCFPLFFQLLHKYQRYKYNIWFEESLMVGPFVWEIFGLDSHVSMFKVGGLSIWLL